MGSMKKDILIGALVGFLTGTLLLVILAYLDYDFENKNIVTPLGVALLFAAGVWLGYFLSRFLPIFRQFGKFAAVGFLSASIDFAILNIVSGLTGVTAGSTVGLINIPGFLVAVINGYLWNKLWVFPSDDREKLFHDFPKFLAVTIIGLAINSGIIVALTTYLATPAGLSATGWLNVAKVLASAVALIWNFVGYRFIVFRGENDRPGTV